jgi:hypothetical protein
VLAAVAEGIIGPLQGRLGYQEAGEMATLECENVISIGFTHLITSSPHPHSHRQVLRRRLVRLQAQPREIGIFLVEEEETSGKVLHK